MSLPASANDTQRAVYEAHLAQVRASDERLIELGQAVRHEDGNVYRPSTQDPGKS